MKKTFIIFFIFLGIFNSFSQETLFGLNTSTYYTYVENKKTSDIKIGGLAEVPFGIGVFVEKHLKNQSGIKISANYFSVTDKFSLNGNEFRTKQNNLTLTPLFKFDVSGEYNKGFYLLGGPRITFLLNSKTLEGDKLKNFYTTTHFGAQIGFGIKFLKHFSFEAIGDYGLSKVIKEADTKGKPIGIYGNLSINLESIIIK